MKYIEPIQRGLRPWKAVLQKISEIIFWLQQSRLIAGYGISLIETGSGIIINAEVQENVNSATAAGHPVILARIRQDLEIGYLADLYGNGLDQEPTEREICIFLPEISYGTKIAADSVVLVNQFNTRMYDVNAERIDT